VARVAQPGHGDKGVAAEQQHGPDGEGMDIDTER